MRAWLVGVVVVVLLASACSDDSGGDDAASTTNASADTSTTQGQESTSTTTETEDGFAATTVAAGDQHACALDPDGTAWCWGYNHQGQIGDGSNDDAPTPVAVAGDHEFTGLVAGRYFTCGLDPEGAAWCWGDNSTGGLGNGATGEGSDSANTAEPVAVLGDHSFTELTAGQLHACGLEADGALWCWGAYPSGQLGIDVTEPQTQPVRSAGDKTFSKVVASGANTCALDDAGTVWCFGNNSFGQLGNGETDNAAQPTPGAVVGGPFEDLAIGDRHACALDADGAAWCWGYNGGGQLGDGTTDDRLTPVQVDSDIEFVALVAGNTHTCGLDADGVAWCWGANAGSQLGDGSTDDFVTTPVAVAGDLSWDLLALGEEFSCGVGSDGVARCWGSAGDGWLGDGSGEPQPTPTPVAAIS